MISYRNILESVTKLAYSVVNKRTSQTDTSSQGEHIIQGGTLLWTAIVILSVGVVTFYTVKIITNILIGM